VSHGGVVTILDMDEPFMGGQLTANGLTCGFTMEQSADATAQFVGLVKDAYPDMLVGETEPYPYFSVAELEGWTRALEDRGVHLAHFHIDVDPVYARDLGRDVAADLRELSGFLQEHGIPFGVILTSDWTDAGSNRAYFESTLAWLVRSTRPSEGLRTSSSKVGKAIRRTAPIRASIGYPSISPRTILPSTAIRG
jgi:hypothetical protein